MSDIFNILISYPFEDYQPDMEYISSAKLELLLIECIDDYLDNLSQKLAYGETYEVDDE